MLKILFSILMIAVLAVLGVAVFKLVIFKGPVVVGPSHQACAQLCSNLAPTGSMAIIGKTLGKTEGHELCLCVRPMRTIQHDKAGPVAVTASGFYIIPKAEENKE